MSASLFTKPPDDFPARNGLPFVSAFIIALTLILAQLIAARFVQAGVPLPQRCVRAAGKEDKA